MKWRGFSVEFAEALSALTRASTATEWRIRAVTVIPPLLFLAVVVFQPWFNPRLMFLDTIAAAETAERCCNVYFGIVSTSGIILWAATAAVCLFSAFILFARRSSAEKIVFAFMAGTLTGWLTLDDAFLLHERILPALGIPQNPILAFYVIWAAAYFTINRRLIMQNDFWILVMGAGGFAVSIWIDVSIQGGGQAVVLLEDAAKFFAIVCWSSFHTVSCARLVCETER